MDREIKLKETMEILGVKSNKTIYNYIEKGYIKKYKKNANSTFFLESEIKSFSRLR